MRCSPPAVWIQICGNFEKEILNPGETGISVCFCRSRSLASARMRRPSLWLLLVVVLLGVLILRDPRLRLLDDRFLAWFMQRTPANLPSAPVTQVEIGREDFQDLVPAEKRKPLSGGEAGRRSLSPLEYGL